MGLIIFKKNERVKREAEYDFSSNPHVTNRSTSNRDHITRDNQRDLHERYVGHIVTDDQAKRDSPR